MPKGYTPRRCVDCGKIFDGWGDAQIRCPECQKKRRKEMDRLRHIRQRECMQPRKKKTKSMVVDGHVQICRYLTSCVYGSDKNDGCSYALEEGKCRTKQGLWIIDGKCPAYEKKAKGHRYTNRQKITVVPEYKASEIYEV